MKRPQPAKRAVRYSLPHRRRRVLQNRRRPRVMLHQPGLPQVRIAVDRRFGDGPRARFPVARGRPPPGRQTPIAVRAGHVAGRRTPAASSMGSPTAASCASSCASAHSGFEWTDPSPSVIVAATASAGAYQHHPLLPVPGRPWRSTGPAHAPPAAGACCEKVLAVHSRLTETRNPRLSSRSTSPSDVSRLSASRDKACAHFDQARAAASTLSLWPGVGWLGNDHVPEPRHRR